VQNAIERYNFSGTVLVAQGGQVILSKGYGLANVEHDAANTPHTKFRVGSLTKQFTAVAIMMLQERGLLSVRDPICRYLPQCPNGWQQITIHHLLTHTSGLPDISHLQKLELPLTAASAVEYLSSKPLRYAPGERFSYGGSNYVLLGFIIEKASTQSYDAFLQKNIFAPLGMKDTGYDDERLVVKDRAAGYSRGRGVLFNAVHVDMTIPFSAGGLYSTVEDLYRWDQALYTEKLVSRKSLETIFTPFKGSYGYGWYITEQFGRRFITHGGWINGFAASIARLPDDRVTAIVLSNLDGAPVSTMARNLVAVVIGVNPEATSELRTITASAVNKNSSLYDAYSGQYELPSGILITVSREGSKLLGQTAGYPTVEILPESDTAFFVKELNARIRFVKHGGHVTHFILNWDNQEYIVKKLENRR
jgi:CubicO group peptidase (beta-lactamase class C family)